MLCVEYVERLKVNEKSDVYSFGVVLLELVTGMKAIVEAESGEGVDIVRWIYKRISMDGRGMEVLDESAVGDSYVEQMMRVLRVGLMCTNRDPNRRPCMRRVVEMLEKYCGETSVEVGIQHEQRISSEPSDSENEIVDFLD